MAAGAAAHDHDVVLAVGPLALCAEQAIADFEDQVVPAALDDGASDAHPELDGRGYHLSLCDGAFLVRAQHNPNTSSCHGRKMRKPVRR